MRHRNKFLKFLSWDTKFFGRNCYSFEIKSEKPSLSYIHLVNRILKCLPSRSFISVRIPDTYDQAVLNMFEDSGFRFIDTEITLYLIKERYKYELYPGIEKAITVHKISKNKNLPYVSLGNSFYLTRFHRDVNIATNKANKLWIEYIKNFTPDRNNHIFVAKFKDKTVGAVLVKERKEGKSKIAEICFICMLKKYQNKKVGSKLLDEVKRWVFKQNDILLVGTQARNINALNFYLKNNLSILRTKTIMHGWFP